jgi:SAM-dependent methyltransferase
VPLLRAGQPFTAAWPAAVAEELCAFGAAHWPWILAGLGLLYVSLRDGLRPLGGPWRRRESATPFALSLLLAALFIIEASDDARTVIAGSRNFYGTLKVRQYHPQDPAWRFNLLAHGATSHGLQFTDPPRASEAASYYSGTSGVGRILDLLPAPRRVGVVGLGTGTLAAYGLPGDHFRFYDINPDVIRLARRHFSYLERSVAGISLALGDARLVLEAELAAGDQPPFDLLVLDAFSSDAIPVHLLTREAVELYLRRLKPDGVLAFHLSNRHLRLEPVVEGHARRLGLTALTIEDDPPADEWWRYPTTWMLLSRDRARLTDPGLAAVANVRSDTEPAVDWTDDHASLLEVLR